MSSRFGKLRRRLAVLTEQLPLQRIGQVVLLIVPDDEPTGQKKVWKHGSYTLEIRFHADERPTLPSMDENGPYKIFLGPDPADLLLAKAAAVENEHDNSDSSEMDSLDAD
jgi:hypothetical protein